MLAAIEEAPAAEIEEAAAVAPIPIPCAEPAPFEPEPMVCIDPAPVLDQAAGKSTFHHEDINVEPVPATCGGGRATGRSCTSTIGANES